jgi:hypothetical protein
LTDFLGQLVAQVSDENTYAALGNKQGEESGKQE